jgi:N-methylhydantoinase B
VHNFVSKRQITKFNSVIKWEVKMTTKGRKSYDKLDPVTLEVIHRRLESIANEMEDALMKSSFAPTMKEMRDGSSAIFDAKGRTVAQAVGLPGHLGMLMGTVPAVLKSFPVEQAQEGDIYIHNDPFDGGTHVYDITMVCPVIFRGETVALAVSMVHHIDMGAMTPGVPTSAINRYQEGLTLPAVKYYDAGKRVKAIYDIIRRNVRVSDMVMGDLEAQVAGGKVGAARILELFGEYGKEVILAAMEQLMDHSEVLMRHVVEQVPDGTYPFVDYMDNDGVEFDKRVRLQVAVTIKGSDLVADFTGSNPQTKGGLNCTPCTIYGAVAYNLMVVSRSMGPEIPTNEGCFRPIRVILPEDSVVNPKDPAATGIRATTLSFFASVIGGAFAKALPGVLPACGGVYAPLVYFGGTDPLTGKEYLTTEVATVGIGGRPTKDGVDAISADIANLSNIPAEYIEMNTPLRFLEWKLHQDSAGAGEYRGGLSVSKAFQLLRGTCSVTFRGERYYSPAFGLYGGHPGALGKGVIMRKTGEKVEIPSKGDFLLYERDIVAFDTSGAGGYGNPLKRIPEAVLRDVLDEKVSLKAAAEDYGVVIDEKLMTVNTEETMKRREEIARKRGPITWTFDQGPNGRH